MYNIQKGIPIPTTGLKTINKFPFNEMDVEDSFFVPDEKKSSCRNQLRYYLKENLGKAFTSRKMDDGVRIWRIK